MHLLPKNPNTSNPDTYTPMVIITTEIEDRLNKPSAKIIDLCVGQEARELWGSEMDAVLNCRSTFVSFTMSDRGSQLVMTLERRGWVLCDDGRVSQAWCKECGQQAIDLNANEDTCGICMRCTGARA